MKKITTYIIEKLHINKDIKVNDKDDLIRGRDIWDATSFEKDDILDGSYVYTSKHPKFYKVISNNGKTVKVVSIGKKITRDDGYGQNGYCVPDLEKIDNEVISARINNRGRIKISDATCCLWDGEEVDFYTD